MMAVSEACQVWIEQRIEEELQDRGETGKSFREIGRELAAEIEKIFEAKVNPRSLEKKAGRMTATNVAPKESTTNQEDKVETVEPQQEEWTKDRVLETMNSLVDGGLSIREASRQVAAESGRTPHGVRRTFTKAREAENTACKAQFAWQYAKVAIYQLERIAKDDSDRIRALTEVRDWINSQEGM